MVQKSRSQQLNGLFPLSYVGVIPTSPQNFTIQQRPPNSNDWRNHYIGDIWLDNSSNYPPPGVAPDSGDLWILVSVSGNSATWINFGGGGGGSVNTLTGNTGGPVGPTAGNINVVGDGTTINIVGTPGTSTLTVSVIGTGGTACAFLAIQTVSVPNATGDGTVYSLGEAAALTTIFDVGGDVYIGDGAGAPATFTAPATGFYYLEVGIELYNLQAGVFNDSIATYTINTPARDYECNFSPLGTFAANAMVSDSGSLSQGFVVNLTVNDVVTFTCESNLNGGGGVKNIGVRGVASPVVTFISGFIISGGGGGGGGVQSVSAGNNIVFTGGDPVNNPIINVGGTNNHSVQLGNSSGSLTSLSTGSPGQLLQSAGSSADPSWTTSTYPSTNAQGDLIYGSALDIFSLLVKDTNATRYLSNTGASNNPAWAQVNVANGVTGVLPIANGGTNASSMTNTNGVNYYDGTRLVTSNAGTNGQVLIAATAAAPAFASLTSTGGTILFTTGANSLNLEASGTSIANYTNVNTTPYVVLTTDDYLGVDCSGGIITVQLPNAPATGRMFTIKDRTGSANTNNITVTTVGGVVNIDGATSYTMNTNYASIQVLFDGTTYQIF